MANYREMATRLLTENMNAIPGETFLVVIDTDTDHIGRVLFETGVDLGLGSGLFEIPPVERNGMELPESVTRAMESVGVVVCPANAPPTHTRARRATTKAGTRVATIPGITDQMFSTGAITTDYEEIERLMVAFTEGLTAADEARIEAGGAPATMSFPGRDSIPGGGIIADPGDPGNLPSGKSCITPVEGMATGTLVFDGGLAGVGVLDDPLTVELDAGHITSVEDAATDEFPDMTSDDDYARRVCELSLGTNPAASIIGIVLEDEEVYDTCHAAFGDDLGFGGTIGCDSHLDGVVLEPAVLLDGDAVVVDGEVCA